MTVGNANTMSSPSPGEKEEGNEQPNSPNSAAESGERGDRAEGSRDRQATGGNPLREIISSLSKDLELLQNIYLDNESIQCQIIPLKQEMLRICEEVAKELEDARALLHCE